MRGRLATAVFLEFRTIPVLLWSFTAVALGTAIAVFESGRFDPLVLVLAFAIATLIQGFETHAINEIYDLRSGTDRDPSPRLLSGGSRVLTAGLLSEREMWIVFGVSSALIALATAALVALRGPTIAAFAALGYTTGLVYTLPPIATSYRPFLGEWSGGFLGVFAGGLGAYVAQAGRLSALALLAAGAHAFVCVGMLLVHHYLDRDADLASIPPKRTTVAVLGFPKAKFYTMAVAMAPIPLFTLSLVLGGWPFAIPVIGSLVGLAAHSRLRPRDPTSVTPGELRIIEAGIAGGVGGAIALAPVLWPLAPVAVAGFLLHLRVGARYVTPPTPALSRTQGIPGAPP